MRHRGTALPALAAVLALPLLHSTSPAEGQSGPASAKAESTAGTRAESPACGASGAPSRTVADLYEEAFAEYKKEHYAKAYCDFLDAYRREQTPKIVGNLGRVEMKLGKPRDAAEHLSGFLRDEIPAGDRAEATRLLAEAKTKIGTLQIEVAAKGAEIWIDGARVGIVPLAGELYVAPGRHTIEARLNNARASKTIDAGVGSVTTVALEISGASARTPVLPNASGSGSAAPVSTRVPAAPPPSSAGRTAFLLSGVALGVVALGVGVGASFASIANQDDRDACRQLGKSPQDQQTCWTAAEHDRALWARGATAGFIVGGAAVTAGILGYLLWPSGQPRTGPTASVQVGPQGGGLVVSGSF